MSQLSTVPACLSVFDAVPVFPLRYFLDHVYLCNLFLHNLHYLWRGGAFRLRCFFAGLTCLTASGAVTVRTSQPPDSKPSAIVIGQYSSKAVAGKELSLSSWCIASLYIYHFSTVIDFSSQKYSGSTAHKNSWYH